MKVRRTAQMPSMVPVPMGGSPDDDYARQSIERLEKEVGRTKALCEALFDWLAGDAEEQIEQLTKALAAPKPESQSVPYFSAPTAERLIELTKNRNELQELLDTFDEQVRQYEEDDDPPPGSGIMVAVIKLQTNTFRDQVEYIEKEITHIQSELEKESTSVDEGHAPEPEEAT